VSGVYPDPLPAKAKAQLVSLGVQVLLNTKVTGIDVQGVQLGDVGFETSTVIWAAGVQASSVDNTAGWEADRAGGVIVQTDLSVPGQSSVFVIGDQAAVTDDNGVRVPGLAPAALRMGKHTAKNILADLANAERTPVRHRDHGSMATIGRARAVAQTSRFTLSGMVAWVFIHIATLITFRNRVVVLVKWAWDWAASDRSSRLIWETKPSARKNDGDDVQREGGPQSVAHATVKFSPSSPISTCAARMSSARTRGPDARAPDPQPNCSRWQRIIIRTARHCHTDSCRMTQNSLLHDGL
jgi:hypothetical protein